MTTIPTEVLESDGFTWAVRERLVREVAARRGPEVKPHRDELDHLLTRLRTADREMIRRQRFYDAMGLACFAGRRPPR